MKLRSSLKADAVECSYTLLSKPAVNLKMTCRMILYLGILLHLTSDSLAFFNMAYKDYFPERCTDYWIHKNITGLRSTLERKLYGQHLALKAVTNHLRGHVRNEEPERALAMSFHGYTGTGKNYVSKLIAEHFYLMGMKSKFVHLIPVTREFTHESRIDEYKDRLKTLIEGSVAQCPDSFFIFDEVDKMPAGLLDTIKPYLEFYDNIDGVNYRKAIYIFLGNSGSNEIVNFTYQHWRNGKPRETLVFADLEKIITTAAVNADKKSGLWHSELITKHMITSLVPFLPLTGQHVVQCIKDSLIYNRYYGDVKDIPDAVVQEVLDELTFFPEAEQIYSISGCKRVADEVKFVDTP